MALFLHGSASSAAGIDCETPGPVVSAAPTGTLAAISWNVHGLPLDKSLDGRVDNIAGEIRRLKPDVVLLQEVWLERIAARFDCRLRSQYQRIPDPEGVSAGLLSWYGHRRGGLLALVRRDSPWKPDGSVAPQFTEFSATAPWYRIFSEADTVAGKGTQRFGFGDGRLKVTVLHTHLQARYPGRTYEDVRLSQIRQLLTQSRQPGFDLTLVVGDFNTRASEVDLYAAMTADLKDLTADFRRACGCGTLAGAARQATDWIDYVLARSDPAVNVESQMEQIRNTGRDDPYSDHHGIWLQMRLKR